jgi:tetratricopeptide (TPR) repeat protein
MRVPLVGLLLLFIFANPTTSQALDAADCINALGHNQIQACSRIIKSRKLLGKPISKRNLARFYGFRGFAYENKGEWDRAIADYTKAIALEPKGASAYFSRGLAYETKGDKEKAIADLRKALEIRPSFQYAKDSLKRLGVTP